MTATAERLIVTQPGQYDLDEVTYHADPVPAGSLSSSGARKLLPPSCPAKFAYERKHPKLSTAAMELGTAAHRLVLGVGPELVCVDADSWRTNAAKEQRDDARAAGAIPLLAAEYEQVQAMAAALRQHPIAAAVFDPDTCQAEQSLFCVDGPTGVWRRARPDSIRLAGPGRPIIADYKSTKDANPDALERTIFNLGYHQQAPWYLDTGAGVGLWDRDAVFVFVFQEKEPPYLVTVVEPTAVAMRIGRMLNRRALATYAECAAADRWPGYADDVIQLGLPHWAERQYLEEM